MSSDISFSNNETKRYETVIVGDAICGKTTYLNELIKHERSKNSSILVSDDNNKLEFIVEYKNRKAAFILRDTANQEKFRSLTQTHYKKAQCALITFDVNNLESFYNLPKWYSDILKYCNNQKNFAVLLVGFKKSIKEAKELVSEDMIEKFQVEFDKIIDYCFIDLSTSTNLKEPYQILLNYLTDESRSKSTASLTYNNYVTKSRTPASPVFNLDQIEENDSGSETVSILNSNKAKQKKRREKGFCEKYCCCCCVS